MICFRFSSGSSGKIEIGSLDLLDDVLTKDVRFFRFDWLVSVLISTSGNFSPDYTRCYSRNVHIIINICTVNLTPGMLISFFFTKTWAILE